MIAGKRKPKDTLTLDQARGNKPKDKKAARIAELRRRNADDGLTPDEAGELVTLAMNKTKIEKVQEAHKAGTTRIELMRQAQERGIKYFRILSRVELIEVMDPDIDNETKVGIVADAIKRWKGGWGSRKATVRKEAA